jgi:glycosyltransferase involved in cell wall biosynthesis
MACKKKWEHVVTAPLLTLIIPVYNVAPYLRECLDSVATQTHPIEELIIVDDGSTDESPEILQEYAAKMPQMHIIWQENSGQAVARNTGMQHARGRYLAFADADDFAAPQMYEHLLGMALADNLDISLCNAHFHFEGREADRVIYSNSITTDVIPGKEWLRDKLKNNSLVHMVWMHLYRRDFLLQHNFSFTPRILYEDVIWTTEVLLKAKRIRYDATPLYSYRIPIRHFSIEQNRRRLKIIIDSSVVNARTLTGISNNGEYDEELSRLLRWQAVDGSISIFHKIEKLPDAQWQRERYREIYSSGLFSLLWKNAVDWRQRRRIARNYLKSFTHLSRAG